LTSRLLVIVNPRSANGSTGRHWPKLERQLREALPPFDAVLTRAAGDAVRLAADGANRYGTVVAVGGDGTISEVANGILAAGAEAALGVIPRGTGSDLVRTLGIPTGLQGAASVLARGPRRRIDVGRATFLDFHREPATRWFLNAAEVGVGAMVVDAINHASRRLQGPPAFWWAILTTMFRHRPSLASVVTDRSPPLRLLLSNAWVANGRYSGGGIRSAPRAAMDDGLLDVVLVEHGSAWRRVAGLLKLRSGAFVELSEVQYRKAAYVEFTAQTPLPIEIDGDAVGTTPATFEIVPSRLTVVAPRE
jgi:YegS/Rv2252/BmrU family lipid kinase